MFRFLPKNGDVAGWFRRGAPRSFDAGRLWDYIDGGADVYIDYGFKEVVTAEYVSGERTLVVEIYEMQTFEGAFGIYARERAPTYMFLPIGAEGYLEGSALNFYQGKWYVKSTAFTDDRETKAALRKMAETVSRYLGTYRKPPPFLQLFPPANRKRNSEGWEPKSFLGCTDMRGVFTAEYGKGKSAWTAFLHACENEEQASARLKSFRSLLVRPAKPDEFRSLGGEMAFGRHRDGFDVLLIVRKKFVVGMYPIRDKELSLRFMREFLARID
ncbi:MAG: hypothetical protein QHI48_07410 [Bacteroidota bacterium]|nr:hypothetical protein [Bacteroidota bacterium]